MPALRFVVFFGFAQAGASCRRLAAIRYFCPVLYLLSLTGCGIETYEKRLDATRSYYAYLDKLDQNLSLPWRRPPVAALRVPKQFQEVSAPQVVKNPDGSTTLPEVDPRQPDYLGQPINGLLGAWHATVDVNAGGQRGSATAYLYVASNFDMLLSAPAKESGSYSPDLLALFEANLQTNVIQEQPLMFPKGNQFVPRQSFDAAIFRPEMAINETRYVFEVYMQRQGDNQVALIFARPEGLDPQSKVAERIQLMLESLRITAERPQPKQPGKSGPPTAPGGGF